MMGIYIYPIITSVYVIRIHRNISIMVEISYSPLSPLNPGILQGSFSRFPLFQFISVIMLIQLLAKCCYGYPGMDEDLEDASPKTFVDQLMEDHKLQLRRAIKRNDEIERNGEYVSINADQARPGKVR